VDTFIRPRPNASERPVQKWITRRKTPQEATPSGPIPIAHSPPARTLLAGPDYAAGNIAMHSTSTTATAPQDLWTAALERLEPRYNKPVFEMWLKPMRLVELTPSEIVLAVQTTYGSQWLKPTRVMDARLLQVAARLDF